MFMHRNAVFSVGTRFHMATTGPQQPKNQSTPVQQAKPGKRGVGWESQKDVAMSGCGTVEGFTMHISVTQRCWHHWFHMTTIGFQEAKGKHGLFPKVALTRIAWDIGSPKTHAGHMGSMISTVYCMHC